MSDPAAQLAVAFKRAARRDVLEKDFRQVVEAHLLQLAQQRGIDLVPHSEVTLGSSGRADTIYNRFIIEWEKPGSLKASNTHTKNRETIAQCQRYGDSLFWVTREKPGRIVGCCTDQQSFPLQARRL